MARALRVEYEGARYHVMCRGNHQQVIFKSQADVDLFLKTLGEMCVRNEVVIHAYCLMSNHYHMLMETPRGNLVDAMKWFQGTFTQRYNAMHGLWGHLFQGRYKAKVIDSDDPHYFCKVGEYVHLNPSDAGVVEQGKLADYPWSSYPFYLRPPSKRPQWLSVLALMQANDIPADTAAGRRAFSTLMDVRQMAVAGFEAGSADALGWERMERGWVHGHKEFRDRMVKCIAEGNSAAGRRMYDREQKRDLSEIAAAGIIKRCLDYFELEAQDLDRLKKSDARKMLIAGLVRYHYPVSVGWVCDQLKMGHFTTVSRSMNFYDEPPKQWIRIKQDILKIIG
jgi:REP element-mobilizing transposase RayT